MFKDITCLVSIITDNHETIFTASNKWISDIQVYNIPFYFFLFSFFLYIAHYNEHIKDHIKQIYAVVIHYKVNSLVTTIQVKK